MLKICLYTTFLLLYLVGCPLSSVGQSKSAVSSIPPKRDFRHHELIVEEPLLRDRRRISVALHMDTERPRSETQGKSAIAVVAGFDYSLDKREMPKSISLSFFARLNTPMFQAKPEVSISFANQVLVGRGESLQEILDGSEPRSLRQGEISISRHWEAALESDDLFVSIPIESFLEMINAERILVKCGSVEFRFRDWQMEALRDLASRLAPHAQGK